MRKALLIILSVILILTSCTTDIGNPIASSYRISPTESDKFAYYYLRLKDDGTFTLIQAGGESSSSSSVINGEYSFSFSSFNFVEGSGSMVLNAEELSANTADLALKGGNNYYTFYFTLDKNTGARTLTLEPQAGESAKLLAIGFSISDEMFESVLNNATKESV